MPSVDHPSVSTCEFVVSGQVPGSKIICRPYGGSGVKPDYVVDRRNGKHVYFHEIEKRRVRRDTSSSVCSPAIDIWSPSTGLTNASSGRRISRCRMNSWSLGIPIHDLFLRTHRMA